MDSQSVRLTPNKSIFHSYLGSPFHGWTEEGDSLVRRRLAAPLSDVIRFSFRRWRVIVCKQQLPEAFHLNQDLRA